MRVLGVDPGLRVTGYAVVSVPPGGREADVDLIEAGVIRTPGSDAGIAARVRKVHDSLSELIGETRPDALVIERLFAHYKHPATAILMGHVRGVVCLLSSTCGVPLHSIASTQVKKAVTGQGHATKLQVQRMIQHTLRLKALPEPSDVADALAIALAYALNTRISRNVPSAMPKRIAV